MKTRHIRIKVSVRELIFPSILCRLSMFSVINQLSDSIVSRMAHRKAGGSSRVLRDSNPQYPGVKLADGQKAKPGAIIVRQRGSKIMPGVNVSKGKDDTLFSLVEGTVKFESKRKLSFNGSTKRRKIVSVITKDAV